MRLVTALARQPWAAVAAALLLAAVCATTAAADSAPIPKASPPWADPAHRSPLEVLAGRIASGLAGREVSVRCESEPDWQAQAGASGTDAAAELGYVPVDDQAGTIAADASLVELSPGVCEPLQQFAAADPKPTKCSRRTVRTQTIVVTRRIPVRTHAVVGGHERIVVRYKVVRTRKSATRTTVGPPGPCFAGGAPVAGDNAFWSSYADYATALLVLAHETVHLTQDRAGRPLPSAATAEPEAQCVGMQWLPTVARELGDTADDAQAIAQYAYADLYPNFKGTVYWSAECGPGRALDRRAAGARAWP